MPDAQPWSSPGSDDPSRRAGHWQLLGVLPYLAVVAVAVAIHPRLLVASSLATGATLAIYLRLCRGQPGRMASGALVALALLLPCLWTVVQHTAWPGVLCGLATLGLFGLNRASRGAFARWWREQAPFASLMCVFALLGGLRLAGGVVTAPLNDDALLELYAAPAPQELEQTELDAAVGVVSSTLRHYHRATNGQPEGTTMARVGEDDLDSRLARPHDGEVWVTLWLGGKSLRGRAAEGVLLVDLARATRRALDSAPDWSLWVGAAERVSIQIDLAEPGTRVSRRWSHLPVLLALSLLSPVSQHHLGKLDLLYQLVYEIEPGVDGLALRVGEYTATILPADPIAFGWLSPRVEGREGSSGRAEMVKLLLGELGRQAGVAPDGWRAPGAELRKFRTLSFGRPAQAGPAAARRFYRGNVLVPQPDDAAILSALGEAGDWLRRSTRPDGTFDYDYLPNSDRGTGDYNLVRHAGSVYGLFFAYRLALGEDALRAKANDMLEAGLHATDWLYPRLAAPVGATDTTLVALNEPDGAASSGGAAVTLLTMLERPSEAEVSHPVLRAHLARPDDPQLMRGLGRFLLALTDRRGRVFDSWAASRSSPEVVKEAPYSPGETLLALVRLYRATGEREWLDGARAIAASQIAQFEQEHPRPDHWVMQALGELFEATGERRYADVLLRMGDQYVTEQYPPLWLPFPDYFGSYHRDDDVPRTTRACSSSEAMGAVVRTAWRVGRDARPYEDSLLRAAKHLLEHQWRPENSFFLRTPARARGAIRMGLVDNQCRIDNNQHALVGLRSALDVARRRQTGAVPPRAPTLPPVPSDEEQRACRKRFGDPVAP